MLQELLKTRTRKIIAKKTQNIKELKTNKLIKARPGILNLIDLVLADFFFFFLNSLIFLLEILYSLTCILKTFRRFLRVFTVVKPFLFN